MFSNASVRRCQGEGRGGDQRHRYASASLLPSIFGSLQGIPVLLRDVLPVLGNLAKLGKSDLTDPVGF
jgi:hypothetical protein